MRVYAKMRHFHLAALGVQGVIAILVAVGTVACAAASPKATPTPEPSPTPPSRIPPGGGALGTKAGAVFILKGGTSQWPGIEGYAKIDYQVKITDIKSEEVLFEATLTGFDLEGKQISNETRDASLSPLNIWNNAPAVTLDWGMHRERWAKGVEQMKIAQGTLEAAGEVYEKRETLGGRELTVVYFFASQKVKDEEAKTDMVMERTYGYAKELGILVRQLLKVKGLFQGAERDAYLDVSLDSYQEH